MDTLSISPCSLLVLTTHQRVGEKHNRYSRSCILPLVITAVSCGLSHCLPIEFLKSDSSLVVCLHHQFCNISNWAVTCRWCQNVSVPSVPELFLDDFDITSQLKACDVISPQLQSALQEVVLNALLGLFLQCISCSLDPIVGRESE